LWKALVPQYVCTLEDLGLAMIHAVRDGYSSNILENLDIARLGRAAHDTTHEPEVTA
jgi:hypothetical protein